MESHPVRNLSHYELLAAKLCGRGVTFVPFRGARQAQTQGVPESLQETNAPDARDPSPAAARKHRVRIGRAYDARAWGDGARVLVDRLWPRGLSSQRAEFDEWQKDIAPSTSLREWYGHDPDLFTEFTTRYREELKDPARAEILMHLAALARHANLTLLTASKASEISEAAVLVQLLTDEKKEEP